MSEEAKTLSQEIEDLRAAFKPMFDAQREADQVGLDEAKADLATLGVDLYWIGGNCPVQAEGELSNGREFYFRARGDAWQFHVFPKGSEAFDADEWECDEPYGSWPDAGWMPQGEALHKIAEATRRYQATLPRPPEQSK